MYLSSEFSPKSQIKRVPNPAKQLLQILINDREISEWFYNWKKDILDFQYSVEEKIVEEPERTSRYVDDYRAIE